MEDLASATKQLLLSEEASSVTELSRATESGPLFGLTRQPIRSMLKFRLNSP